jgi:hypothetical protein
VVSTITITSCEFCNNTSETSCYKLRKCEGCKKDICSSCYVYVSGLHDGDCVDLQYCVCKQCAEKIGPYEPLCDEIREKAYQDIEELIAKWKKECGRDTS